MTFLRRRFPKPFRVWHREPTTEVVADTRPSIPTEEPTKHYGGGRHFGDRPDTSLRDTLVGVSLAILVVVAIGLTASVSYRAGEETVLAEWRAYPTSAAVPYALPAREGGPCAGFSEGVCPEATELRSNMARARYFLRRGDAEVTIGSVDKARRFYEWSVEVGRPVGAIASRYATTRLQFLSLTCDYDARSLARISRNNAANPLGGEITTEQRQRALRALSHYVGAITGRQSRETREAARRFQSSLWFDETGVLTSEQVVLAVCGAAEIGLDAASQNLLGSMYAVGLGTRQSTDKALQWFQEAARQGSADANWNLALLFGTQTTESSVLVCDADQNAERADSYLKEAYDAGHPAARQAVELYGDATPEERWRSISAQLRTPEALLRVGKGCNPNG